MPSERTGPAGSAYFVPSVTGGGPAVVVLHSWWGLTDDVRARCDDLSDRGFVVIAPDLQQGRLAVTDTEAEQMLAEMNPDEIAGLIISSVGTVRTAADDPTAPVGVVGFFSGASWALWLATRQPDSVRRVVAYYGTQDVDFADLSAPVMAHFGRPDEHVTEDQVTEMHAHLLLAGKEVTVHHYEGVDTFFAERGPHGRFSSDAAELAWLRTVDFLAEESGITPGAATP